MGKLALGFIAISMGVALGQIEMAQVFELLLLFGGLGVFGYGWNDWCDRDFDRLADRANAFDRRTALEAAAICGISALSALVMSFIAGAPGTAHLLFLLTGAEVLLSAFYSAPGIRLKERGWIGLASVIAAQYIVPGWILLAAARSPHLADWLFLGTVALFNGLTLEAGHQLADRDNDISAGVRTLAVSDGPERLTAVYRGSSVVLGVLFAACPVYLAWRFVFAGAGWVWAAWMAPCVLASAFLSARTFAEMRHSGRDWAPHYAPTGPATRLLFSYFPNCFLPLWVAIAAAFRHPQAWALPLVALGLLAALALANESLTTGAMHYGLKWHLRQTIAMFAGSGRS